MSVAVIIPTMCDRDTMTMEAIESALKQTVRPSEIFIICETGDVFTLIDRINHTIKHMESTHFVLLCDDDLLMPDFVEECIKYDTDIVYGAMEHFGNTFGIVPARDWGENIKSDTVPFISSLSSKAIWEKIGGFDQVIFCDWDYWWKCYEAGATITKLDKPLFKHRQHKGQSSHRVNWEEARSAVLNKHKSV